MTKLVLDFGRVTRIMRVKLTVIVDDESDPKTSKFTKVVDKSNYKGVEYSVTVPTSLCYFGYLCWEGQIRGLEWKPSDQSEYHV